MNRPRKQIFGMTIQLFLVISVLALGACGSDEPEGVPDTENQSIDYEKIRTDNGLSFVYPSSWYVSNNTSMESLIPMSNQPFIEGRDNSTAIFQAHYTASPETANFMVRASKINPAERIPELVPLINENKVEFGLGMQEWLKSSLPAAGQELVQFHGVRTLSIDGNPAFVIEFERTGPRGNVRVYNLKVEHGGIRYGINLGYLASESDTWHEVIEHMLDNIAFDNN